MDHEHARDFMRQHHRAILATHAPSGRVQMSPVIAGVDAGGSIVISTRETAFKTRNLRRDPRAVLCVQTDEFFGPWIQIDGAVDILSLPDAMEPLVDYYRRVVGEHPDWQDYRRAMERERRVLLRLAIERAGPDRSG